MTWGLLCEDEPCLRWRSAKRARVGWSIPVIGRSPARSLSGQVRLERLRESSRRGSVGDPKVIHSAVAHYCTNWLWEVHKAPYGTGVCTLYRWFPYSDYQDYDDTILSGVGIFHEEKNKFLHLENFQKNLKNILPMKKKEKFEKKEKPHFWLVFLRAYLIGTYRTRFTWTIMTINSSLAA